MLMTFEKNDEERERIARFNMRLGLPVCFDDVEISEDEFDAMADKAMTTTEWQFNPKSEHITKENFIQCMIDENAFAGPLKPLNICVFWPEVNFAENSGQPM